MKVIIAGSRMYNNDAFIERIINQLEDEFGDTLELVSGTANGPDTVAINYAKKRGIVCHEFPADWDKFGKSAGPRRNEEMAGFADALIAFHCLDSKGTKNMIENMNKRNKSFKVYDLNGHLTDYNNLGNEQRLKRNIKVCSCGIENKNNENAAVDLYAHFGSKYFVGYSVCKKCILNNSDVLKQSKKYIENNPEPYTLPKFEKLETLTKDYKFEPGQFYGLDNARGEFVGILKCAEVENDRKVILVYHNQTMADKHNHQKNGMGEDAENMAFEFMPNRYLKDKLVTAAFLFFDYKDFLHRGLMERKLMYKIKLED